MEDRVVQHGDDCVPNVLFAVGQVSDHLSVADCWSDLAVATWA
jgi:aminoglycoside phosphotransferase